MEDEKNKGVLYNANRITNVSKGWELIKQQLIYILLVIVAWSFIEPKNVITFSALIVTSFIVISVFKAIKFNNKIVFSEFLKDLGINLLVAIVFYYLALVSLFWGVVGFFLLALVYAGYRVLMMKEYFVSSAKNFGEALKDIFKEEKK